MGGIYENCYRRNERKKIIEINGELNEVKDFMAFNNAQEKNINQKEQIPQPKQNNQEKQIVKPARKKYKRSTQKEMKEKYKICVERVVKGESISDVTEDVFGYRSGPLNDKIKDLIPKILKKTNKQNDNLKENGETQPKKEDKRTKRSKYVFKKAHNLVKQFNYSMEKALSIANDEWMNNKLKFKKEKRENKIDLQSFDIKNPTTLEDEGQNEILMGMLKNMIANNLSLKYYPDGETIGVLPGYPWKQMLINICTKSDEICKYFYSKGKFVMKKNYKGYHELFYEIEEE